MIAFVVYLLYHLLIHAYTATSLMIKHINKTIHYGSDSQQYGKLIKPITEKERAVVIVIHGGYWKDNHSVDSYPTIAIVDYLKSLDVAIWNLEYRRMDFLGENAKAPWPAVHLDIANGIDFLTEMAVEEGLDLSCVFIIGHSAGGCLAAWAGCRAQIPSTSILFKPSALKITSVLSIAGILNLSNCGDVDQPEQVLRLMGGSYQQFPERYQACDPNLLHSACVDLCIMHGNEDKCVEVSQAISYYTRAASNVEKITLPRADHFSMLPHEGQWHQEDWLRLKNVINKKIIALG